MVSAACSRQKPGSIPRAQASRGSPPQTPKFRTHSAQAAPSRNRPSARLRRCFAGSRRKSQKTPRHAPKRKAAASGRRAVRKENFILLTIIFSVFSFVNLLLLCRRETYGFLSHQSRVPPLSGPPRRLVTAELMLAEFSEYSIGGYHRRLGSPRHCN